MKVLNKITPVAFATAMAISGMTVLPLSASAAGMSSDLAINSMYLWRGLDQSGGPSVSGSIGYDFGNGFSIGTWASSEATSNMELDLYGGYKGAVGKFGYGLSYATYLYPENAKSISDSSVTEYVVNLSYADFTLDTFINADAAKNNSYMYYSLGYAMGKVGFHYGITSSSAAAEQYSDLNVSFEVAKNLKWTISSASGNKIDATPKAKDPLVVLSYSVPL